jgi:hypothetical protein
VELKLPLLAGAAYLGLAAGALPVQAARPYRFGNAAPITDAGDRRPVPVPRARAALGAGGEYVFDAAVRYPAVGFSETWKIARAGDVNALDEVPESSWFTPRLGARELSPDEGLRSLGAPSLPLAVLKVFADPDGGLLGRDATGKDWFVDFDPRGHGGLRTTAGVLANRIFGAFGLNVPEDHVIEVRHEDLIVPGPDPGIKSALDTLLAQAAASGAGRFRARASRALEGTVIGPFSPRGVRIDDPNDIVPHENRRTLRALRVFGALVNLQEIRPANTLDVYEGEAGQGFVRHYFLDLGQAFGGYSSGSRRYWSGYNHYFTVKEAALNLATFGLYVGPWEEETTTAWPSVGTFESSRFEPSGWRETAAFAPIRRARPEDDYWAAKRLVGLSPEHLRALVDFVRFPDPGAAEYMVSTLLERRQKLVAWAFSRVTPLEAIGQDAAGLRLRDQERGFSGDTAPARYRVTTFDGAGHSLDTSTVVGDGGDEVRVPMRSAAGMRDPYLRVEVLVLREGRAAPRPAEFHLRPGGDGDWRLVGVVH